ncbi:SDR family oxidoreductase [Candidatus Fermentibacterales bacterium]|nr:SDR family oxidoreductase [Candidatus Fermentibacterales bacterium]
MTGRRCLVTGGAGFIGSNMCRRLLREGCRVRILDNFSTGRRSNILDLDGDVELLEGDLRSYHTVKTAVRGIEVVYHLGALPSVPRSIADPITTNEVNVQGTLNVLHAALDEGVGRVVFASSSSIYGDSADGRKSEDMTPAPLSPYAVSKLAGETYCRVFTHVYGLETVCVRYFNVFGPYQDPGSHYSAVIPLFATAILDGRRPVIYGDGRQSRDFTYVDNVVHANLLAAESKSAAGMTMNAACGTGVSVAELARRMLELLGRPDLEPVHEPERPGEVRHSVADTTLARRLLGYEPLVCFEEGLEAALEHFRSLREKGPVRPGP